MAVEEKYKIAQRGNPEIESPDSAGEIHVYAACMRHVVLSQKDMQGQDQYICVHPGDVEQLIYHLMSALEDSAQVIVRGEGPWSTSVR